MRSHKLIAYIESYHTKHVAYSKDKVIPHNLTDKVKVFY